MFIRPCYRTKNGKRHADWALMESYRTDRGPRQRVVAYLGRLDEAGRLGVKQAADGKRDSRQALFPEPQVDQFQTWEAPWPVLNGPNRRRSREAPWRVENQGRRAF